MAFKKFQPQKNFERKMYQGHWKCADCGKEITELPFEPDADRPVYCRECWAKRRASRR
ncbi:MAG: hypothetical protein DRH33_00440 [Candidatus Nealsonbacteria bacterium]|nr:MAG: hypothetical protein DRH33_00440 [Candidatus Nealsonbacteria bacterium]